MRALLIPMRLLAGIFRLAGGLLNAWPVLLVAAYFVLPTVPHLRWEYSYRTVYDRQVFLDCTYLGPNGLVMPEHHGHCPFIALLNTNTGRGL